MARLSDNYYLRKCFMEREQVPSQSVMINKMSPPLAKVYFQSMDHKLKVLAGLEPPLKGGGFDWYIPPEQVLDGRLVMQPLNKEYLTKLGFDGIALFGNQLVERHHKRMEAECNKVLLESDINWKNTIETNCKKVRESASDEAAEANTVAIRQALREFTSMYTTSITKIEMLLYDAAIKETQAMREAAVEKMSLQYESLLKSQATMLYDRYTKKLENEYKKIKENFIQNVQQAHTAMVSQIHDIKLEKHVIIEKVRQLFESMNLACQVYVALKEREECKKEIELSQHIHKKTVKALQENIAMKDFEISLALEKEKKREDFNMIWKKKICEVVKKFQLFATFCFKELPEHADFFTNMEKLMLIQLNKAAENPDAESVFEPEEAYHTPVARPHPFYLFCDKGYKPQLDQELCPKHCTSSASQLPVIIVNKRCIYAACDNFEKFTDKVTEYIHGKRGDDIDFIDDRDYDKYFPVNVTSSQHLLELKLQSSLMQILQDEIPNVKTVPTECCGCDVSFCFCSPSCSESKKALPVHLPKRSPVSNMTLDYGKKIETRSAELALERDPKWESYMEYVMPKKCRCPKRAKKHLEEHMPSYMRNMSKYDEPCLPNYEKCNLSTLQKLVKKAKKWQDPPPPPKRVPSKTREVSTQYSNQEFDLLCTCFSHEEVEKFLASLTKGASFSKPSQFQIVGDDVGPSYMARSMTSFATECVMSLRNLLEDAPQLQEVLKKKDCQFD